MTGIEPAYSAWEAVSLGCVHRTCPRCAPMSARRSRFRGQRRLLQNQRPPDALRLLPRTRHPHPPMRTSQQPLRAHLDTADSGHRGPRIDCGAGHHAVMPHHRRMAFGYGTSVPTRGLGAVIASRNGVGRVEGRRGRHRAVVQRGGIVMTTGARADCVGELRLPGIADHV